MMLIQLFVKDLCKIKGEKIKGKCTTNITRGEKKQKKNMQQESMTKKEDKEEDKKYKKIKDQVLQIIKAVEAISKCLSIPIPTRSSQRGWKTLLKHSWSCILSVVDFIYQNVCAFAYITRWRLFPSLPTASFNVHFVFSGLQLYIHSS